MKKLIILSSLLLVVMTACNTGSSERRVKPNKDSGEVVNFKGYEEGCRAYYNPIFCADKFKPKNSLSSGIGASEGNYTIYIKDEDGKVIVLDKNQTEFLLKLKK